MRTKSPSDNIPSFENLYEVTKDFIKEHQGEKGYINTDFRDTGTANDGNDIIYGMEYCEESSIGEERIVFGVRVREDDIEVLMRTWMRTYHNAPTEEEYADDNNWKSLRWGCNVYYIATLMSIAECIEEYIESFEEEEEEEEEYV